MLLAGCVEAQEDDTEMQAPRTAVSPSPDNDGVVALPVVDTEPSYYGAPLEGTLEVMAGCPVLRSPDGTDLLLWMPGAVAVVGEDGRLEVTTPSRTSPLLEGEQLIVFGRAGRPAEARGPCTALLEDGTATGTFLVQSVPE